MRIPNKVVCLWSCLTAFTFIHTAVAQEYPVQPLTGAGGYYSGAELDDGTQDPYGQGYAPMAYNGDPAAVYADPAAEGYFPAGPGYPPPMVPPNTNYWPQVSPFGQPVLDRTYRENGIWVNDPLYGERSYSLSLEYMRSWYNRPGTDLIGARGVFPSTFNSNSFQATNAGVFSNGEDLVTDGLRGKFVIANSDTSSLEFGAFWGAEANSTFQPYERADPADTSTLFARGFLGLSDGTTGGVEVGFDTDFVLNYKAQAFGADITYATMPFYEVAGFKLRPTFGAKYLKLREQFTLYGEDSALNYDQNPIDGSPIPGTIEANPFGNPAFSSNLTSRTKSDLAGPEAGLRYEIGGKTFLLTGQSRLAVAVNHERIVIDGNQIGDGFGAGFPTPTLLNPKPAYFRDGRSKTHVSPIFTQDFQFKGKVFKAIPLVNDIPLFANADLLVGYNFILVGNVARPTKVIDWRVNNPKVDLSHSRWFMQSATFGMQWEY